MQAILELDSALFFFLNQTIANPLFDLVFPFITRIKNVLPVLILACLFLLIKGGKRGRVTVLVLILSIAAADLISHEVFKPFFHRARPCVALENVRTLLGIKTSFSFPSNHAANITAAAVSISFYYRKWICLMAVIAVLIGFSRIYTGVHYPSDVIAGAILGGFIAAVVLYVFSKIRFLQVSKPDSSQVSVSEPKEE